jgi:hypothetical protein
MNERSLALTLALTRSILVAQWLESVSETVSPSVRVGVRIVSARSRSHSRSIDCVSVNVGDGDDNVAARTESVNMDPQPDSETDETGTLETDILGQTTTDGLSVDSKREREE